MDNQDNFIFSRIGTGGAEFKIYQSGEVTMGPGGSEVFDLQPTGDLEIAGGLTAGGIYYASDRNLKENFTSVDTRQVLEKVAGLEISHWNYRSDEAGTPHLGPMAQDFYAAFGLGSDDKTISASDVSGVALAAIQGLYRELETKDAAIAQLRAEKESQQAQINELMKAVAALQAHQTPRVGDTVKTVRGE